ncbi:MAG: DNA-binding protein [Methylovulum sp.]|nr:MAG: DNA-binding protein [Methylovulum sp.]
MHTVVTIQFTQEQARALTGVSVETIRHWRKTIPYLASKSGKSSRFTFADLVGLAVTNTLVTSLGIHISSLSGGVDALFKLLGTMGSSSLDDNIILVTATDASFYKLGADQINMLSSPALMVPLAPLVANIQRQVLPIPPISHQLELPFPPIAIKGRA